MKQLYLLRHAKSSWEDAAVADFERPLAVRGRRACASLREAIGRHGIAPALILCSAARRTQETLQAVAPAFAHDYVVAIERRLYLASAAKLLERIRRLEDDIPSVMLIGHNPGLQRVALLLAGGGAQEGLARLKAKFPTAALAELAFRGARWRDLAAGKAELVRLLTPREVEAGARRAVRRRSRTA